MALVVLTLLGVLRAWDPAPVEGLRLAAFDVLQAIEATAPEQPFVTIVAIDDASLTRHGQWPWPRTLLAQLVARIASDHPTVIGFDLLFPEPDRLSPDLIADQNPGLNPEALALLRALPSNDERFASALATGPTVLGIAGLPVAGAGGARPTPVVERNGDPRPYVRSYETLLGVVVPLADAASGFGLLSVEPERDGVVRRLPLIADVAGTLRPALAVELLRIGSRTSAIAVDVGPHGVDRVAVAGLTVPTASDGRVWLRHRRQAPGRIIPASLVLDDGLPPGAFANRIVIVANTATGFNDYVATPIEPRIAGSEVHAQLVEAIATGAVLVRPWRVPWGEAAAAVLVSALLIGFVPRIRPELGLLGLAVCLGLLAITAWYAFRFHGLLLDPTFPGATFAGAYAAVLGGTIAAAEAARRALRHALEQQRLAAQRLEGELAAARDIQMGILPRTFPAFPDRTDVDIHALIEPARAVGGDFYDFALVDGHRLFFMLGDVSGKGVPAALFMALSKVLAKSAVLREPADIGEALTAANKEIVRENAAEMFVTLYAGVLDLATGELQSVSAGHDAPVIVAPGQEPRRLESIGGPPMCVLDDFAYASEHARLEPGDAIVLFTDGVSEAQNAAGELFGLPAIWRVLEHAPSSSTAAELAARLNGAVETFVAGAEPADDVTILVVRWPGRLSAP